MLSETRVGPSFAQDGAVNVIRSGRTGEAVVSDAHSRFREASLRNALFSAGMTLTSISNATFSTGTLGSTATPIIGVWNPFGSGKNVEVLQARVQLVVTAATATGAGAFMWCTAVNQSAISTGITPLSRFSLAASGAVAKGYANTALTGLSGNLTVQEASGIQGGPIGNFSMVGTAAGFITPATSASIDLIDGAWIVPPGGVLALLCTTNAPVAVSAASSILWEESVA